MGCGDYRFEAGVFVGMALMSTICFLWILGSACNEAIQVRKRRSNMVLVKDDAI